MDVLDRLETQGDDLQGGHPALLLLECTGALCSAAKLRFIFDFRILREKYIRYLLQLDWLTSVSRTLHTG